MLTFNSNQQFKWLPLQLLVLKMINSNKNIGRYKLAKKLQVSEYRMRAILSHLKKIDLIETKDDRQKGHQLSLQGTQFFEELVSTVNIICHPLKLGKKYTIGEIDGIVLINGEGIETVNTVFLRDYALLFGALGCTVFYKDEKGNYYLLDNYFPPLPPKNITDRQLISKFTKITNQDNWKSFFIIAGTSPKFIQSLIGAIGASIVLIPPFLIDRMTKI